MDKIQALCVETTNANLGLKGGAAAIFEQILNRNILYLPCRHHIHEIISSAAFTAKLPGTSGPNNPIFLRLRTEWDEIQSKNATVEHAFSEIHPSLKHKIPDIIKFIKLYLLEEHPRADYREFLELSLMFLGEKTKATLHRPGAGHHAR